MYKIKEEVINQSLKIKIRIEVKAEAKIHIIEMMNQQIKIRGHLNFID
jgi:hypothetical protein